MAPCPHSWLDPFVVKSRHEAKRCQSIRLTRSVLLGVAHLCVVTLQVDLFAYQPLELSLTGLDVDGRVGRFELGDAYTDHSSISSSAASASKRRVQRRIHTRSASRASVLPINSSPVNSAASSASH